MNGHILLVDDNPNDIELALVALESGAARETGELGGHAAPQKLPQVTVAGSGVEALETLHRMPAPDLVLLDLNMPHMDGLAVLDAIRSQGRWRDLPVVMLTTSGEPDDIERCYQHGATAYVVKPLDFEQFLQTMQTVRDFWMNLNRAPRPA